MIKKLLAILVAIALLTGCADETILATKREVVVVKPSEVYYSLCPAWVTIPPTPDVESSRAALLMVYGAYDACRLAMEGIRKDIKDSEAIITRNNKPN